MSSLTCTSTRFRPNRGAVAILSEPKFSCSALCASWSPNILACVVRDDFCLGKKEMDNPCTIESTVIACTAFN
jgi:hypothetical protein